MNIETINLVLRILEEKHTEYHIRLSRAWDAFEKAKKNMHSEEYTKAKQDRYIASEELKALEEAITYFRNKKL